MKNYRSTKQLIQDINRKFPKIVNYKGHFLTFYDEENKYLEKNGNNFTENFIEVDEKYRVTIISIDNELIEKDYSDNDSLRTNYRLNGNDIIDYILKYRTGCRETAQAFNISPASVSYYCRKANNPIINEIMREKKEKTAKNIYDITSNVMDILDKVTKGEWRAKKIKDNELKRIMQDIENKITELNNTEK